MFVITTISNGIFSIMGVWTLSYKTFIARWEVYTDSTLVHKKAWIKLIVQLDVQLTFWQAAFTHVQGIFIITGIICIFISSNSSQSFIANAGLSWKAFNQLLIRIISGKIHLCMRSKFQKIKMVLWIKHLQFLTFVLCKSNSPWFCWARHLPLNTVPPNLAVQYPLQQTF